MIKGLPYFGKETNNIIEQMLNSDIQYEKEYDSLYIMIKNLMYKRVVVVIDNQWITWLNDITFNYRDKECYLPYYTYELYEDIGTNRRTDDKGRIVLRDSTWYIKYNYNLEKLNVDINNLSFIVYDIDSEEKFKISTNKWINSREFSMEKLYNLYLDSCYTEDDFKLNYGGDIYNKIKGKNCKEDTIRKQIGLNTYSEEYIEDKDYRDVRQYRYNELILKTGFREEIDLYRYRRLKFEMYLFCLLRGECEPIESTVINDWHELGVTKDYIKIGENIKLIIKAYWLNKYRPIKQKTWSRQRMLDYGKD